MQKTQVRAKQGKILNLDQAKSYLRISPKNEAENPILLTLCDAVESWANGVCKRNLTETEYVATSDEGSLKIIHEPFLIIEVRKVEGSTETVLAETEYTICINTIIPKVETQNLKVIYNGGFEIVPDDIRSACLLKLGSLYDNRENGNKRFLTSAEDLLLPYRNYNI